MAYQKTPEALEREDAARALVTRDVLNVYFSTNPHLAPGTEGVGVTLTAVLAHLKVPRMIALVEDMNRRVKDRPSLTLTAMQCATLAQALEDHDLLDKPEPKVMCKNCGLELVRRTFGGEPMNEMQSPFLWNHADTGLTTCKIYYAEPADDVSGGADAMARRAP